MTNSEKSAEERVKERWPDAFAWQDEDGHWYISLPHLGESQDDDHNALNTQREESAWADAPHQDFLTHPIRRVSKMANAADGYLGDFAPHRATCRCTDCQLDRAQQQIARAQQHIAQLHSEVEQWKTWGVIEIAARNPNVSSYMEHWEGRATKAEAENAALRERVAALEAFASKWATDAPLSERRTLHEVSVAYRKAAGIFPNPEGVKAILDK